VTGGTQDPRRYMQVAASVRGRIASGSLKPDELVSITDLVAEHYVSRGTARSALIILQGEELVKRWPGIGYVVARRPGPR
jgi:DNA-binding GntR family transcriptional regulator